MFKEDLDAAANEQNVVGQRNASWRTVDLL